MRSVVPFVGHELLDKESLDACLERLNQFGHEVFLMTSANVRKLKDFDPKCAFFPYVFYCDSGLSGDRGAVLLQQILKLIPNLYILGAHRSLLPNIISEQEELYSLWRIQEPGVELRNSILYIVANLNRDSLNVREIACATGVSESKLKTLFHEAFGISPWQYVMKQRVELGINMIKQNAIPIAQVSTNVGFADLSSFYRAFRKHTGRTPGSISQSSGKYVGQTYSRHARQE